MAWFLNRYQCTRCDVEWEDEYSCMVDDECPQCGRDFSPYDAIDKTFAFVEDDRGVFMVEISPDTAEYDPAYEAFGPFADRKIAEAFAADRGWSL